MTILLALQIPLSKSPISNSMSHSCRITFSSQDCQPLSSGPLCYILCLDLSFNYFFFLITTTHHSSLPWTLLPLDSNSQPGIVLFSGGIWHCLETFVVIALGEVYGSDS